MALVPIRVDRTSKPPLGTPLRSDGHWSVHGLTEAYALNEGAGNTIFGSYGRDFRSFLSTNAAFDTLGLQTKDVFVADGAVPLGVVLPPSANNDFTLLSLIKTAESYSTEAPFIRIPRTDSAGDFSLIRTIGGYLRLELYTTAYFNALSNIPLDTNTQYAITGLLSGKSMRVYQNGTLVGSNTLTTNFVKANKSAALGTMGYWSNTGTTICQLIYDLALSPEQIASISANPWQIYEPETVWIEVGGGGDFVGVYAAIQAAQSQGLSASLDFNGYSVQSQPLQSEIINTLLQFSGGTAQVQAANSEALLAALSFSGPVVSVQGVQGQSLASSLTFDGSATQTQASQAQAIYQALLAITGAVSQTQAAQIASLSAALIFGGSSEQTQTAQIEGLAAVLAFAGSTSQGQAAQAEALAALLSFSGDIDQEQAIQIEALTAILAAMDITGTVEQVQERQLQAASDFVAQVHAILRVTASDPLALSISVRDPLALRVTVQ